jgi:hypothetical protein
MNFAPTNIAHAFEVEAFEDEVVEGACEMNFAATSLMPTFMVFDDEVVAGDAFCAG